MYFEVSQKQHCCVLFFFFFDLKYGSYLTKDMAHTFRPAFHDSNIVFFPKFPNIHICL